MSEGSTTAPGLGLNLGVSQLRPGSVQLALDTKVSREDLHKVLDRILDVSGCPACGLLGFDLVMRGVDPRISEPFRDIEAVRDVVVMR